MNNNLVQRLRDTGPGGGIGAGLPLCREAADRIEALEARNRELEDALCEIGDHHDADDGWTQVAVAAVLGDQWWHEWIARREVGRCLTRSV